MLYENYNNNNNNDYHNNASLKNSKKISIFKKTQKNS